MGTGACARAGPRVSHTCTEAEPGLAPGWPGLCWGSPKIVALGVCIGAVAQGQRGFDISRLGSAVPDPFLLMLSS